MVQVRQPYWNISANKEEGILLSPKVSFQVYQQKDYQMTSEESVIRFVMRQTEFSESLVRSLLNHLGFAQETLTKPLLYVKWGRSDPFDDCFAFY